MNLFYERWGEQSPVRAGSRPNSTQQGPMWSGPCLFTFPAPPPSPNQPDLPSDAWVGHLGSYPRTFAFAVLRRMLCPQIFPWLVPPCQAGLSSHVPPERPSLTSVTEVAHTSPLFISARQCFSCSNYYCKQLPYLFTYLIAMILLPVLFSAPSPVPRRVPDNTVGA